MRSPEAPPSYDSLYGQLRQEASTSTGKVDFLKKCTKILLSTIGFTICVGLALALPIASMVIGSIYVYDCRIDRYIPIYLIVAGVFGTLKAISDLAQRIKKQCDKERTGEEDRTPSKNPFDGTLGCFLFAWFIVGNVYVYRAYNKVNLENPDSMNYCPRTCYLFAFWSITLVYILIGLVCCTCCVCGVLGSCVSSDSNEQNGGTA